MGIRFVGVVVGFLTALMLLGWTVRVAVRRLGALESAVARLEAGIEPVHSRCEALEAALSVTKEEFVLAEREVGALSDAAAESSSLLAKHATSLADSLSGIERLRSELVELEDQTSRRASSTQSDLDGVLARLNEQGQSIALLGVNSARLEATADSVPPGTILPWLPTEDELPAGWVVCDGTYGTPDLRGLFLRGASFVGEAGRYEEGATMLPAGRHSHATEEYRTLHSIVRSVPRAAGDWRVLFDTGVADVEPQSHANHGEHVHEGEHVPAHLKVVFIMKEG